MTQYFKQPVLIIDYSFVAGGIGAQAGELNSEKVDWLQEELRKRELDLRQGQAFSIERSIGMS